MKKGAVRTLQVLRWITFISLFLVSVLFLIYCAVNMDRRLVPAVICVLGTSAMLVKEIWLWRRFRQ